MTMNPARMSKNPSINCSPAFKGVILKGMEETIGPGGLDEILDLSGLTALKDACKTIDQRTQISYHDLSSAQKNLETVYGKPGGRGLALIAGRNSFALGMRQFGKSLGLLDLDFRLLPSRIKLQTGLKRIASYMNQSSDSRIRLEEDARQYRWIIEACPLCWHRHADVPICHMQVGMLQEFTYWASGGKNYAIVETECSAAGAEACVFTIDKTALE